jgi:hypothetical protein
VQDQLLQDRSGRFVAGLKSQIRLQGSSIKLAQMLQGKVLALADQLTTDRERQPQRLCHMCSIMALLYPLLDTPEQTDVTDHHAQDEQRRLPLVQQTFDNDEGRAYLARPQGIRQSKNGLQT